MAIHKVQRSAASVWWTNPSAVLCALAVTAALIAANTSEAQYIRLWRVAKLASWRHVGILLLLVVGPFLIGAISQRLAVPRIYAADTPGPDERELLRRLYRASVWLAAFGYCAWALNGFSHGVRPWDLLALLGGTKSYATLRAELQPVTGITNFVQLLILGTVTRVILLHRYNERPARLPFYLLVGAVVLRALMYSERLAVIEVVIPWLIIRLKFSRRKPLIPFLPVVLVAAVVAYFGVTERTRSWETFYKAQGTTSFSSFVVGRLTGYYVTAFNNGAAFYDARTHSILPYYTLEGIWNLPLVKSGHMFERITGDPPGGRYGQILSEEANAEYNNPSGGLLLASDVPPVVCASLCFATGYALHLMRRKFLARPGASEIWYPILFVGVVELPLVLYWNGPRVLPVVVVYWAVSAHFRRRRRGSIQSGRNLDATVQDREGVSYSENSLGQRYSLADGAGRHRPF